MSEEKWLTKFAEGTGAIITRPIAPAIEGLEDLDINRDITLGRWRLVQPVSHISGQAGEFNNNLTGEIRPNLALVVLKINPSRACFSTERKLLCTSRNAQRSLDGKDCLTCPSSQWGEDGERPGCDFGYTFLCYDPTDQAISLVGASGAAVPTARRYLGLLVTHHTPPFAHVTVFSAHEEKTEKGKWMALDITLMDSLPPDQTEKMRTLYHTLIGLTYREMEEPTWNDVY